MRKTILKLEKESRKLEPTPAERKRAREKVVGYAERFLDTMDKRKAYVPTDEKGKGLYRTPFSESGISIGRAMELIENYVDREGINPASGGHLGYIPGGGVYYSSLGDYLADVTNRYAGVFFANPGAVRMENMCLRWLAKTVGYPADCGGNLTTGGSLANLIGIVTARDAKGIRARDVERSVIYLTSHVHHSVDKAIRIAGLREAVIRHVPLDDHYRMSSSALQEQVAADRAAGLNPFLVIASAGTTDVGAIDPLEAIARIAAEHGLWYHVDAAYGGFFVLTAEGKKKLRGMELSDSLVIDPHKGLFLPYGSGVVLVKDRSKLQAAHYYSANYMQDAVRSGEEPSPADLSPELTKHFRGLRMWLALQLYGVEPFRACLQEKLLLTRYFHNEVRKLGFEVGPEPELSVATYRFVPENGDANAFNKRLIEEVMKDGRVFISSTLLDGRFTLRFACMAFRTHLRTVDTLLSVLKQKVKSLQSSG